jgi:Na+/proline symporter
VPFFFNQIIAITFNLFAGGTMIYLLTGIPLTTIIFAMALIALIYTLISGIESSIVTDMVQMVLILVGIFVIVPWTVIEAGGLSAIVSGLGGLSGKFTNIFNPEIMFSLGLINSIGLISGTIADQQYWQRTFSIKKDHIVKAFIFGGLLFAVVPIMLSLLGFLGANPELGIVLGQGTDPSLIGVVTVTSILPRIIALVFVLIMMGGLTSTIDSGISAASSLWVTDVKKSKDDKASIQSARFAMIGATLLGLGFAYGAYFIEGIGLQHLWFLSISMVASISVPTILTLYVDGINPKSMFYGILTAIVIGMPVYFYANLSNNLSLQVIASLFMVLSSTIITLLFRKK